jgi:hypothetical protein
LNNIALYSTFTADLQPEFWPTGLGGYSSTTGQWQAGFEAYAQHFHRVAQALNPCGLPGGQKILSGPGWGEQAAGWLNLRPRFRSCFSDININMYKKHI